jgi:hypothetical protein
VDLDVVGGSTHEVRIVSQQSQREIAPLTQQRAHKTVVMIVV